MGADASVAGPVGDEICESIGDGLRRAHDLVRRRAAGRFLDEEVFDGLHLPKAVQRALHDLIALER